MTLACLDIETTTTTHLRRKASPFSADNWIVAAGYKLMGKPVVGAYYGEDRQGSSGWLAHLLEGNPRIIGGFNIKFDLLHLLRDAENYTAWKKYIANGGTLWDAQLAEYLLRGMVQEAQMLSLDEVAPAYGGDVKISEVKAYWEKGINTHEIPRQLLMDYLCGRTEGDDPVKGDVENTEVVILGQIAKARKRGQLESIKLNMGALCATIEMELNGMRVDVARGRVLAAQLKEREASLTQSLMTYLPKDLPFAFNWKSRAHLSALIFGGSVRYTARVPVCDDTGRQTYAMMDEVQYVMEDGTTLPIPAQADGASPRVVPPGVVYYSSGKNKGLPKTKKVKVPDLSKPKSRNEDCYQPFDGFCKPLAKWAGALPGVYSTSSATMEEVRELYGDKVPFLQTFGELMDVTKDLGTYYIREEFDEEGNVVEAKGMLTLVGDDGIVHHKLNHTSTVTARLSSSDPSLQNLPRGDTSDVKQMFVSRFPGGYIVPSDFTALEVYCQNQLAQDKQLTADLRAGLDMHCARLSTVEGLPYDLVKLRCKGGKDADGKRIEPLPEWEVKRTHIKVFSFQRAYGAGAPKIAASLKVAVEDVEKWVAADDARYPGIPAFNADVEERVKQSRVATTKFIQHPTLRIPVQLGRGHLTTFDGKRYVFHEVPSPEWKAKRGELTGFMPTELKNHPCQGLGVEWMKAAMWLTVRAMYRYDNFGQRALLVNTVHDAQYLDAAPEVRVKAGALLHACMLEASTYMEQAFKTTILVPIPSETNYGSSMYEELPFTEPEFHNAVPKVRQWLRKTFMSGYQPSFA